VSEVAEQEQEPISDVTWEDPPPDSRRRYDWVMIREKLEAKPGEWAKVFENDRTSIATALKSGSIRSMAPSTGIEVRTTNNTRGHPRTCTLFLRYNPQADTR
jgi:hypothetical protein